MKTTSIAAVLFAGLALAAPAPVVKEEKALDKRLGPFALAIVGGVAAAVTGKALELFKGSSRKRAELTWDSAREGFLTKFTNVLDNISPDDEASVCVRNGTYTIDDESAAKDLITVEAAADGLADFFDCFFLTGPVSLNITGGTGPTDIAIQAGPCTFEDGTLTCS